MAHGVRLVAVGRADVLTGIGAVAVAVHVLAHRAPAVAVGVDVVATVGVRLGGHVHAVHPEGAAEIDQTVLIVVLHVEAVLGRAGVDRRVVGRRVGRSGLLALVGAVAVAVEVLPHAAPAVAVEVEVVRRARRVVGVEAAVAVVVEAVGADLGGGGVHVGEVVATVRAAADLAHVGAVSVEVHVEALEAVAVAVGVEVTGAVLVGEAHHAVAVLVVPIGADLGRAGVHQRVGVVAVDQAAFFAGAGAVAVAVHVLAGGAVAVAILVEEALALRVVEVRVAIAVVVDGVGADLGLVGVLVGVGVVAVEARGELAGVEAVAVTVQVSAHRTEAVHVHVDVGAAHVVVHVGDAIAVVVPAVGAVLAGPRVDGDARVVAVDRVAHLGGAAHAVAVAVQVFAGGTEAVAVAVDDAGAGRVREGVQAVAVVVHEVGAELGRAGVDGDVHVVAVEFAVVLTRTEAVPVSIEVLAIPAVAVAVGVGRPGAARREAGAGHVRIVPGRRLPEDPGPARVLQLLPVGEPVTVGVHHRQSRGPVVPRRLELDPEGVQARPSPGARGGLAARAAVRVVVAGDAGERVPEAARRRGRVGHTARERLQGVGDRAGGGQQDEGESEQARRGHGRSDQGVMSMATW